MGAIDVTPWRRSRPSGRGKIGLRAGGHRARGGLERRAEEGPHVFEAGLEELLVERVGAEQALDERQVAEVAEQRAVAGEQQLGRILATEVAGVHLTLEERAGPVEHGTQRLAEIDAEPPTTLERL